MSEKNSFGVFLKELRIRCGYKTQKQLADISGISQTTLSRIEAGTQKPMPETLKALAPHLRPYTYGELMDKAGYFDGMTDDHKNAVISFFDNHEELDIKLENMISRLSTHGEFSPQVKHFLELELGPLLEAEKIDFEYTPSDLRQLLKELDPDLDFKNALLQALIRADKLYTRDIIWGDSTIAAHHDGDDWTEEELEEIERFKEFIRSKRKQQG